MEGMGEETRFGINPLTGKLALIVRNEEGEEYYEDTEIELELVDKEVKLKNKEREGDEEQIMDGGREDLDRNITTELDSTISFPSNSRVNNRASMSSETPVRQNLHDREFYSAHKGADSVIREGIAQRKSYRLGNNRDRDNNNNRDNNDYDNERRNNNNNDRDKDDYNNDRQNNNNFVRHDNGGPRRDVHELVDK
eukprot:Awhi_evm1s3702